MYIDTNGNGVRDGGDILNAGCATTLGIWLDTDSRRGGTAAVCDAGSESLTINSYMFALHVDGGTVSWGASQNLQSSMQLNLGFGSSPTDFVMGFGGLSVLSPGSYHLATVDVTPLSGSPIITFDPESDLGGERGTNFGTACPALACDHTYRLGVDWFDSEGIGPPSDASPPTLSAPATAGGEEGSLITVTVTASDCEAIDVLDVDPSSLPPGATFVPNAQKTSGTLTWTPTFNDEGVYPVTFIASNDKTTTATTNIQVVNRTTLVPYRDSGYRFLQLPPGGAFPEGIEANGYDDSALPVASGPFGDTNCPGILPATYWITSTPMVVRKRFSPGSAVVGAKLRFLVDNDATIFVNGTQVASVQHGGCPFTDMDVVPLAAGLIHPDSNLVVALCKDDGGWSSFDLSFSAEDVGPVVSAAESVAVLPGNQLTVPVGAVDPEGHAISTITAFLGNLPPGNNAAFSPGAGNTSGTLTWTPQPADVRPDPYLVTFTASNALAGTKTTAIRVTGTDTPPTVTAPYSVSGNHGTAIAFSVRASDPEGQPLDSLRADMSGLPGNSGAAFMTSAASDSGAFSWTPDVSAVNATPYPVTFTAWNNLSGSATTQILVTDTDRAPAVSSPPTAAAVENAPVSVAVTASDPDGDAIASLTADLAGLPAGNNAAFTATSQNLAGTLTWTPTYSDARVTPYPVTFTATNALSASAATSIKVDNVDRGPVVTAPSAVTGPPNAEITFVVGASDPDADSIDSLVARTLPPGATFVPNAEHLTGTFAWTPAGGDLCTKRTVSFIAANLLADTTETSITVTNGSCAPVVIAPATVSAFAGTRIDISVTAADPDGDALTSLTADLSGLPSGNNAMFGITALDRSSGTFTWTPTPLVEGTFPVLFTAANLLSGSGTTQIHVTTTHGPLTRRVSVSSSGVEGNASSYDSRISSDGRYVVFYSNASNLVDGDTNARSDVFRRDQLMNETVRVSTDAAGVQGNGYSVSPYVSGDGRFVAFTSAASNLVTGDTNGVEDVFVRDMVGGTIERVSVGESGLQANGGSYASGLSGDGRFVTFCSDATNLAAGDMNGATDVFVRDRTLETTTMVSRASDGTQANARSCENSDADMSADGRFVVFPSIATNLVPDDDNGVNDVFLHDRTTGTTEIISRSTLGQPSNGLSAWPAISSDGRYVAFSSLGSNLVPGDGNGTWDVFVRDRTLGVTERATLNGSGFEANANSGYASLTSDGTGVAFASYASNLVPGDGNNIADVFLRDRTQGTTERVSVAGNSIEATGPNWEVGVVSASGDGERIAFTMAANNLVPDDHNGAVDAFVRDRQQSTSGTQSGPAPRAPRALMANPNPTERGTTISFYGTGGAETVLRIYDVSGRLVRDLGSRRASVAPVRYFWDGSDGRGKRVASGVYFAVATEGDNRMARKVVITR